VTSQPPYDLARITLLVLIICLLIAASLWTVLPFVGSFIWAVTIVVATWPLMLRVQGFAGGRRWVATTIMSVLILAIVIVPFAFAIGALFDAAEHGAELAKSMFANGLAPLPAWVSKVPLIGQPIAAKWQELVAGGGPALTHAFEPYVRSASAWVVGLGGGVGLAVVHMFLVVIVVAILYSQGELAAKGVLMFSRRLGNEQGERAVRLAGMAVRGVALGVIVTALVQSLLAGLGLWVAGVPRAGLLCALALALCVAQIGPLLVLVPAVIWLYWSGSIGWATALLVWSIPVGLMDNFLRPILIRRGVDLPLLLIITGVIGGLIGFGVIGLFVGPVVLAVTYTLLETWVQRDGPGAQ
jgi:predicted PurR-regulated permease PerM